MKKSIFAALAIAGALASGSAMAQADCSASCLTGVDSLVMNIQTNNDGGVTITVDGGVIVVDGEGGVQSNSTRLSGAALARAARAAIEKLTASAGAGAVGVVISLKHYESIVAGLK